jgi:MFS transporter, DHA1 family, tetracycline resistance protein
LGAKSPYDWRYRVKGHGFCQRGPTRPGTKTPPRRARSITQILRDGVPPSLIPTAGPAGRSAATWFVLITVLLDVMALGIMLPALPKLVESFLPGDTVAAAQIYGLFGMTWGLMQFVGSPLLGALSDRFGRRPIILLSNLGLGLDYILMALAPNLWVLLIGRAIAGLTAASFATAFAYVADITREDERAGEFGKIGAMFGLGFIIGPALGGWLAGYDPRLPFAVAAVFSLANAAYGYFVLPESLTLDRRMAFSWRRANPLSSLKLLGRNKRLVGLSVVSFLDSMALVSLPATFVLYVTHRFNWSDITVGLTFAAVGLGLAIVHAGLTGPVVRRLGERRTLAVGLLFGVAGFAGYGAASTPMMIWLSIPLIALWGLADSAMQSLMSKEVTVSEQGQLQGALASLMAIAETIAPILFTQVYAAAIGPAASWAPVGSAFLVAALLQLVGLMVAWRATR